jgi:hypothetical protein
MANPQIAKIYGLQIANPQNATFAESLQKSEKILSANLRNLFADRPPLMLSLRVIYFRACSANE